MCAAGLKHERQSVRSGPCSRKCCSSGHHVLSQARQAGRARSQSRSVHARATQGESHGQEAIERVRGHMRADAACNQHLGSRGGGKSLTPGASIGTFECPPARQAGIAIAELEMKQAHAPHGRPSLHNLAPFPQCTNPHEARAARRNFASKIKA